MAGGVLRLGFDPATIEIAMPLIHLDTDFGGDPDDACALAMLLGSPEAEIACVTTNLDMGGRRAGLASLLLRLAGRLDVPVVAGAGATLTARNQYDPTWGDPRHWPDRVAPQPTAPGSALDALARSIADGATVVAIGALTNLALLEIAQPGSLRGAKVVVMGGWVIPPAEGLPPWGPETDWNIQCDPLAALTVVEARPELTLVTLPVTLGSYVRARDLPRLRASGPVGELLARQIAAHAVDAAIPELAARHPKLLGDLLNFQWDPVTCAVALGWDGVKVETMPLMAEILDDVVRWRHDDAGLPVRVAVGLDSERFNEFWLSSIARTRPQTK